MKTLQDCLHQTLLDRWAGTKDELRSYRNGQRAVNTLVELAGTADPRKITKGHLRSLRKTFERSGLKASTRNRLMSALMAVFSTALEHEVVDRVPRLGVEREATAPRLVVTEEQHGALLQHTTNLNIWRALWVLYETGMRTKELLSGSWEYRSGKVVVKDTKNGDTREVPVDYDTTKYLLRLQESLPMSTSVFHKALQAARKAAGLPETLTAHSLRHSCCTRLVRAGVPLPVIQKWMGHRSIQTTLRYVHTDSTDLEKAFEKFQEVTL